MRGEIIAIGDELTSGRILNTTSSFAAGHLYGAGHDIIAISVVGDDYHAIETALLRALQRAEFIIVTGGLGATSDDLTNESVARILHRPQTFHDEIYQVLTDGNETPVPPEEHPLAKLAWLPQGARVLKPGARMAGHLLVHDNVPIFFLPGVPHEMRELMLDCVLPMLASWQGGGTRVVRQRVYRVFGLGESTINQQLAHLEGGVVRIGYYPVHPEVHVSLTVTGEDEGEVEDNFTRAGDEITRALGEYVYGVDGETMETVVGRLLAQRGWRLALGESCTGGRIAALVTGVAGSSAWFSGGVVAYANQVKEHLLGVAPRILEEHGAVSEPVAAAMARGAREQCGGDLGLAVTGIAGPGGGTGDKPVGLVYLGLAWEGGEAVRRAHFPGQRWEVQQATAMTGLDLVRRHLTGLELRVPDLENP